MRKTVALLTLGLFAIPAHAADKKPKRFSISLSGGVRPDMAGLGATILQDGSIDTASDTMASAVYGTGSALMSDRDNMTLADNSANTDSTLNMLDDYQTGGPMLGGELGGDLRYELDDIIKFPLYLKAGFYYSKKVAGGEQSRTLGDAATANGQVAALLAMNGLDANDYVGGTMKTTWDASWFEIPVSLGVKVPVKPHSFVYGSVGVSYFSGGFSVGLDVDEAYANVLATHLDGDELTAVNQSGGAVTDVARFTGTAVGLNYGLGAQVKVKRGAAVFFELNSSGAGGTFYSNELKPETQQLLTSTSSGSLADADPYFFKKLAYPVVFGGATARIGVRYYLF